MKTALVVGAAGFIGRHLVPKLEAVGYAVSGIDPWLFTCAVTATFEEWLDSRRAFERLHGIEVPTFDLVVHLGANILDISQRMAGGLDKYADIRLDYAVCQYVADHPPREAFIYPSSCATDNPEDPYAWVKLTGERFCQELHKAGVPTVILRPFSGYASDQADSYPFPALLGRAIRHEHPLTVWGSLETVRDWIHIDDLSDAFVWVIENAPRGIPIDIGTGIGTNFLELALMMAAATGYRPAVVADRTKPTSSPRRVADTTLARAHGFEAKITLAEGIRRAVEVAHAKTR